MFWLQLSSETERLLRFAPIQISLPMKLRLWPPSLAARTAVVLVTSLVLVQVAGLTIHALDRVDLQKLGQARDTAARLVGVYRTVAMISPTERENELHHMQLPPGFKVSLSTEPPINGLEPTPVFYQRLIRADMALVPMPGPLRPKEFIMLGGPRQQRLIVSMRLPDGLWLTQSTHLVPPRPWHSPGFLAAFALMTVTACLLTLWAVRRLTAPLRTLAAAAEALGRDVNAPPLPETGPAEIATAAAAFNTMAGRIRRFVQDRTELLTAIGHDLRTPITRLKLRAEFVEDDEQRRKMLADLEELEAMVSATLAFGRDAKTTEAVSAIDLAELLRTVLDEAADTHPGEADKLTYDGPAHYTVRARPLALKRALANLIGNAIAYGGGARVRLTAPGDGVVTVHVEDDGPGIPVAELERVFDPFYRLEASRNRETGGVGLGLPIARNILRAHGGDVVLSNGSPAGLRATVQLPA
jgi:signal transduction histidine kinase